VIHAAPVLPVTAGIAVQIVVVHVKHEDKMDPETEPKPESSAGTPNTDNRVPQARLNEVIAERNEARQQVAQLAQQVEDIQAAQLKEKEDYKALYEQTLNQLTELQPKAEQVDTMLEALNQTVEAQIALLPEDMRDLVPAFDHPQKTLDWLNRNAAKLMKPAAPAMDAGQRGDGSGQNVTLTAEQERILKLAQQVDPTMTRERLIGRMLKMQEGET
jgi:chromosome segregation ATPase